MISFFVSLTGFSHFYIDWKRISHLLHAVTPTISFRDLLNGSLLLPSLGTYGLWTHYLYTDENSTWHDDLYWYAMGEVLGHMVERSLAIAPLVYQRFAQSLECCQLEFRILEKLTSLSENLQSEQIYFEKCAQVLDLIKLTPANQLGKSHQELLSTLNQYLETLQNLLFDENTRGSALEQFKQMWAQHLTS